MWSDLAKPLLGMHSSAFAALSQRVDVIVHNGAIVHWLLPYQNLKVVSKLCGVKSFDHPTNEECSLVAYLQAANVLGTVEIIRLASAAGRWVPVHFISSIASLYTLHHKKQSVRSMEDDPPHFH